MNCGVCVSRAHLNEDSFMSRFTRFYSALSSLMDFPLR